MAKPSIKTKISEIADYWVSVIPYDELDLNMILNIPCCWNCGEDKSKKDVNGIRSIEASGHKLYR